MSENYWDQLWMTDDEESTEDYFFFNSGPAMSSSNNDSSEAFFSATEADRSESGSNPVSYEQFLADMASNFQTILQLIQDTPRIVTDSTGTHLNIYGIISEVADLRSEANNYDPFEVSDKYVYLIDPTNENPLRVRLNKPFTYFDVGDIIRIQNLQVIQGVNTVEYFSESKDDVHIIRSFVFGYNEGEMKNDCHCHTEVQISHYLEQWYANRIITGCRLDKLPTPKSQEPHYVNIVCQVLSKQILQQSMIMRIYDGTTPNRLFDYDETVAHINAMKPVNPIQSSVYRNKHLQIHDKITPEKLQKSALINVWGNESGLHCYHLNTAKSLKLIEGKDLLLFMNVEVRKIMNGPLTLLVMRSGRHKGKAVRFVHKDSVLGKIITNAII